MRKNKNSVSWGLMAVSFVFLFNPNFAIVDFLPDIIGYIIMSVALTRLAMVSESLYDAKRAFDRMIIIDAGKILSIFWVFGMSNTSEMSSSLLLWSFVFGVLEIIFATSAFVKLFEGLSALGDFHPNISIHGRKNNRRKSYTEKIKSFSVFFIVFKAIFTCLPEFTVLSSMSYDESSKFVDIYRYINIIRFMCVLPVIIVGLVWLVSAIKYFLRIKKDREFSLAVSEKYLYKQAHKKGDFIIRDIKIATAFFVVASILTIDFNLDDINIIPDILVVFAMGISLMYFLKVSKAKKLFPLISFALYTVATIFEDYSRYNFINNYTYGAIDKNEKAFFLYITMVVAVIIEGICLVIMYSAMARVIGVVIREKTGYVLGREIQSAVEERNIELLQKRLSNGFSIVLDVVVLTVLADVFCSLYGAFYAFMNKNFGWMGLISVSCGLLLIGMTVKAVSELREAVQTKYMLE